MNKFKCPKKIWNKFSADDKERYNKLRECLNWDHLYHTQISYHPNKADIIDVTAHNIACELVWEKV